MKDLYLQAEPARQPDPNVSLLLYIRRTPWCPSLPNICCQSFNVELASRRNFFFFFFLFQTLLLSSFWTSRGHRCRPLSPLALAFGFYRAYVRRVQQSHCSSIFHRVFQTHVLALCASQFVRKKKSPRIYTSMHSGGFELTKLTFTRLEDNLIRHRGDRQYYQVPGTWDTCCA